VRSHKLRKAPVSCVMSLGIYQRGFNFVARQHCKGNNEKLYSVDRYVLINNNKVGTYFFGSVAELFTGKRHNVTF